ncbi:helix-turn-helix domain-containing protein [Nocardia veterana]|uniref:Helix-turn-helix transcriptional regulator n=1 Tax=Nocardia veterana TaxID=132249 RepID=A0A7X6M3Q1_9NOCA|nr:helix-turn-helix transcriptional regulator [Nocardia veterana]NKY89778.1 helix-turn-helix transcriptional regulator [Nocardia veterana]
MSITGDLIRRHREALGLSQAELGRRVDSSQRQIARFESGAAEPSLVIGLRLAQELGISPTELGGMNPARARPIRAVVGGVADLGRVRTHRRA